MKRIKLPLSRLAPAHTLELLEFLVAKLADNPHVPEPDPPLSELAQDAEALREKRIVIAGLLKELAIARLELRHLNADGKNKVRRLANHVEYKCGGASAKLLSAGFKLAADPRPRGPLPLVEKVTAQGSDFAGQLEMRWAVVPGARCYLAEHALSPDGPWTMTEPATRAECTMTDLTPGTNYWLRVRAFGTGGTGPWSSPICRIAA